MRKASLVLFASVAVALSGCGGGGSQASGSGGGGTVTAGMFTIQGEVKPPQFFAPGEDGGNVYGVTGNITLATMRDPEPTTEESEIVYFELGANGNAIMAISPDGTGLRQITTPATVVNKLAVDPTGSSVYFITNNTLFRASVKGSAPILVLSDVASFAITPSGSVIVASRNSNNEIVRCSATGTNVQVISTPATHHEILACPTESYCATLSGEIIHSQNLTIGTNPVIGLNFASGTDPRLFYNPKERWFFYRAFNTGNSTYTYGHAVPSPPSGAWGVQSTLTGSTTSLDDVAFSIDGSKMVATDGFSLTEKLFYTNEALDPGMSLAQAALINSPAWCPPQAVRTFVGAGTTFPTGVAAILFSEVGTSIPSAVFADAVTRASMVMTQISQQGSSNVVVRLECDNLNKLYYTRGNSFAHVPVVTANSGLKGAIVSFDAASGKVTNVVTFTKKPSVSRTARGYEISGDGLVDALDASGNKRPASKTTVIAH